MESPANPLISVVMPVYNALPFLDDSINSILAQTFSDFEFVIFECEWWAHDSTADSGPNRFVRLSPKRRTAG
jgi:GT2 family glycosyltransferase